MMSSGQWFRRLWCWTVLVLIGLPLAEAGLAAQPPELTFGREVEGPVDAPEGWLILEWSPHRADSGWVPSGLITYELEQAASPSFDEGFVRYRGPDAATFVSGLAEGEYAFRVRARVDDETGPWSAPQVVEVNYVSHRQVFLLMALGAGVFVATVTTIIRGHRRSTRRAEETPGGLR